MPHLYHRRCACSSCAEIRAALTLFALAAMTIATALAMLIVVAAKAPEMLGP